MQKLDSIQCLRGVAAMMVVVHHALSPVPGMFSTDLGLEVGASGVDMFFVLSGFIIYTSQRHQTDVVDFLRRRVERVVPLYWICTGAVVALNLFAGAFDDVRITPDHLVKSLLFVPHFNPANPGEVWPVLVPGWTLAYEMFFYGLFAVGLAVSPKRPLPFLCAALAGLVSAGLLVRPSGPIGLTYTNALLLEFLAGVVLAHVTAGRTLRPLLAWCAPVGALLLLASEVYAAPRVVEWGAPSALVVLGALAWRGTWPRPLRLLGDASYSIYLSNLVALVVVRRAWRELLPEADHVAVYGLAITVLLVASVTAGLLVYYVLERPMLRAFTRRRSWPRLRAAT